MYGLNPDNIEQLSRLKGGEVQQVCVGKFDLQFHLHPTGNISIWSRCELLNANGSVIDTWYDGSRSANFQFADLLGANVADVSIDDATTLRLQFTDGRQLLIFDTSEQYESFSIDNVIV